jgi:hypothetical protein
MPLQVSKWCSAGLLFAFPLVAQGQHPSLVEAPFEPAPKRTVTSHCAGGSSPIHL